MFVHVNLPSLGEQARYGRRDGNSEMRQRGGGRCFAGMGVPIDSDDRASGIEPLAKTWFAPKNGAGRSTVAGMDLKQLGGARQKHAASRIVIWVTRNMTTLACPVDSRRQRPNSRSISARESFSTVGRP